MTQEELKAGNVFIDHLSDSVEQHNIAFRANGATAEQLVWEEQRNTFKKAVFGPDNSSSYSQQQQQLRMFQRKNLCVHLTFNTPVKCVCF